MLKVEESVIGVKHPAMDKLSQLLKLNDECHNDILLDALIDNMYTINKLLELLKIEKME